jgi:hypothetical protein
VFVYLLTVGLVIEIITYGSPYNLLFLSVLHVFFIESYFLVAITNSIIGLTIDVSSIRDESTNQKLQYLRHIQEALLFTVAVVALQVSVSQLSVDPSPGLTNYTLHLGNSLAFLIELGMNALYMKVDYLPLPFILGMLYLCLLVILEVSSIFEPEYFSFGNPSSVAGGLQNPACGTLAAFVWWGVSCLKYGVVRSYTGNIVGLGNGSKKSTTYESSSAFARRKLPKSNGTTVSHWSMLYSGLGSREAVRARESASVASHASSPMNGELAESTCPFHEL